MASFMEELEAENVKTGLFTEFDTNTSYPTGFPILDQQLGFKQDIKIKNGSIHTQYRLGLMGGTINMLVGPSSSGKTAAAIQIANTITEPFGYDSGVLLLDAENSTEPQRVLDLTGMTAEEYNDLWRRNDDPSQMTFSKILEMIKKIAEKKDSDKDRYMYQTGFYTIDGEPVTYYKPTVVIIDSLMRIATDEEDFEEIAGLTSAARDAIFRGKWLRSLLSYTKKYNIIILIINHLGNDIQLQPGKGGAKQLTFIPTGKNVPGGDKVIYYSSSIIAWFPVNSKDQIKTESVNGYNGVTVRALVCKSRSGPGGVEARLEFIQESGFDIDLTLMKLAIDNDVIMGRNPSSYFVSDPSVKFDTRIFVKELRERPELVQTMYAACRPILVSMVRDCSANNDIKNASKKASRQFMRDLCSNATE